MSDLRSAIVCLIIVSFCEATLSLFTLALASALVLALASALALRQEQIILIRFMYRFDSALIRLID